jgi:hypothetical protein
VIWLALAAGVLSACKASDGPSGPPTTKAPDVSFDVTADADGVHVNYRLRNTGADPIVLLEGVPETDTMNTPEPAPDGVYVTARADGTVELSQRAFGFPDGVAVAVPVQIGGTVVPPGAEIARSFTVPLPLRGRQPYGGSGSALPEPVRRVAFCLGVLPSDMIDKRRDGTAEHPVYGHMDFTAQAQTVLCSEPVALPG